MSRPLAASIVSLALLTPVSALAQDWLTPHLEGQRWNNVRRNQIDRDRRPSENRSERPRCTVDMVPAAQRREVEAEYRRRVLTDGPDRAMAWSIEQGRLARERLQERGVCQ